MNRLCFGDWILDVDGDLLLRRDGTSLKLPPETGRLLNALMNDKQQTLTTRQLAKTFERNHADPQTAVHKRLSTFRKSLGGQSKTWLQCSGGAYHLLGLWQKGGAVSSAVTVDFLFADFLRDGEGGLVVLSDPPV